LLLLLLAPGDETTCILLRQSVHVTAGDLLADALVFGAGVLILSPHGLARLDALELDALLMFPTILTYTLRIGDKQRR
jgi:hypothetical protein